MKVISLKLARAEAHSFALEMIRQGIEGGALSQYNEQSERRITEALLPILNRLEKQASVDSDALDAYRLEAQPLTHIKH